MRFLFLTIDLEEFDRMAYSDPKGGSGAGLQFEISRSGVERLLPLLEEKDCRATFFTTAVFARRFPEVVRRIARQHKHEVAVHAFDHRDNYGRMDPGRARERLGEAKRELENVTGLPVRGFRAPRMQAPARGVLKSVGLRYDSSVHPTWVPGRYNGFRRSRFPQVDRDGFLEIPVSVTPLLRLAFSWWWFRSLGVRYAKLCTKLCLLDGHYINIYFHPWDFYDLREFDFLPAGYAKNTHISLEMLSDYLDFCRKNGLVSEGIWSSRAALMELAKGPPGHR